MRPTQTICRTLAFCSLLLLLLQPASAQEIDWLHRMAASFSGFGNGLHVDDAGNVYVTGYAGGSIDLGGETVNGQGLGDLFLAKYDGDRNLQWARSGTSSGWNGGRGIGTDASGNVWVVGRIENTTQFGGVSVPSAGQNDAVVVKYDASGNALWGRSGGGSGMDWGNSVAVAPDGSSVMVGFFNGPATFSGTTLNGWSGNDLLVAAYDPSGNLRWAKSAGGNGADEGYGVGIDGDGNVYVAGVVSGAATFEGTNVNGSADGTGFVAKYGADGTFAWVTPIGGASSAESIAIASDGSILVAGSFTGTISPGSLSLQSAGDADLFVLKLAPDGSVTDGWRYGAGGPDGVAGFGKAVEVMAGPDGSFTLGSSFSNTFASGAISMQSRGGSDIFVARFDAQGVGIWGASGGGSENDHYVSIGVDADGNPSFLGNFFSPTYRMGASTLVRSGSFSMVMGKVIPPAAPGQPVADVSRSSLPIGTVITGQAGERSLTVRSGNGVPLTVSEVTIEGDSPAPFHFTLRDAADNPVTLPTTLTGAQSLTITVFFEPTEPGEMTAELTITTNDPAAETITVPVSGTGRDGSLIPVAVLSAESIDFANVALGDTVERTFTIAPGTTAGLTVSSLEFEDPSSVDDGFAIVGMPSLPTTIPAGDSVEVVLAFSPTGIGSAEARLSITTNDESRPFRNVELAARGTEAPFAVISASSLAFGEINIGETSRRSLTIEPGSEGALEIERVEISSGGSGGFRLIEPAPGATYPIAVPIGTPATITVEFAPQSDLAIGGTLTIGTNDPTRREVEIPLTGSGKLSLSVGDGFGGERGSITLAPHPLATTGHLQVDLATPADLRIELVDLAGTTIRTLFDGPSTGDQLVPIDATDLPSGLYFWRAIIDGEPVVRPIVIAR